MIFKKYILYLLITVIIMYFLFIQYKKIENFENNDGSEIKSIDNYSTEIINNTKHYFINDCEKNAVLNSKNIIPKPNYLTNEMKVDTNYYKMYKKDTRGKELIRLCNTNDNICYID